MVYSCKIFFSAGSDRSLEEFVWSFFRRIFVSQAVGGIVAFDVFEVGGFSGLSPEVYSGYKRELWSAIYGEGQGSSTTLLLHDLLLRFGWFFGVSAYFFVVLGATVWFAVIDNVADLSRYAVLGRFFAYPTFWFAVVLNIGALASTLGRFLPFVLLFGLVVFIYGSISKVPILNFKRV
ncbi:hypothetical protein [Marinobacter sp. AN1]|uniref:hypothetical protein n=1 Tax=Marinobacter sp. AN1 TaxID=2886046 RepID=UPI00222FE9C1|nr:hypothetical protein [Marinobacter sp. AN1]UZD64731.1 hypothetical protein LJ360_14130 [Marinobacter sp. AN1]